MTMTMYNIIKDLIRLAEKTHDEELAEIVYLLLSKFEDTFNCPSNWRDIAEELATEYADNAWVVEHCKLWDFQ